MKVLLTIKERITQFVGKYDVYVVPVLKFLLTYMAISQINDKIGYMARIASKPIALIVGLAGSFLPVNLTIVILGLICVAHIYALSLEIAIVVLAVFLIVFLLYFRFGSKDAVAAILTPICFNLKIPYVLPVSMGLVGTPSSMVAVSCGVIVYQLLHYISINAEALKKIDTDVSKVEQFKTVIDALLGNRAMLLYAIVFAATILVVYIIRRLPIDYCWYIAIGGGAFLGFIMLLIGNSALKANVSAGSAFLGMIISIILNIILQFFCFNLDYNRTEKVQFEDDEYYYYVKAVPKNTVKLPEKEKTKATGKTVKTNAGSKPSVAARKPHPRPSSKAPFGLSGGRPAGAGRRKMAESEKTAEHTPDKVIEKISEDDF